MLLVLRRLAYRLASPLADAWWQIWGVDHIGAKCLISRGGEVLLVRHTYGDRRRWEIPGGLVRRREEPVAAAAREMGEELGLELSLDSLGELGALVLRRGRRTDTVHYFQTELDPGGRLDRNPVELADAAWFDPARLPRPVGGHVAEVLARAGLPPPAEPGTPCVSIGGNQSGESRPGLRGRWGADPPT